MLLQLGVENAAYSSKDAKGATTTWEVAEILEDKYHIMRVFYELNKEKIAGQMVDGMAKQIQTLAAGGPIARTVLPGTMQKIRTDFVNFLNRDEWQKVTGIAIAAAEEGNSLRFKGKKTNARPAFVDTGLYRQAFRAQIK
ncbi:hypothetical protein [Acidiphilium sp.]|uniref:hypothetical protein n=1 Tax=Acidiphilium sp. TaxID=527 RepID=UPI003D046442